MSQEELKQRIDELSLEEIKALTSKSLGVLTNWWRNEVLVKKIIAKAPDIGAQTEIWSMLKRARRRYYVIERHPEPYFNDIDLDLECGTLIKDSEPNSSATLPPQPLTGEQKKKNEDSTEEMENMKEQMEKLKKRLSGNSPGINQGQAALLVLSLANTFDWNYTNKKEHLAPLAHVLFGWGKAKLAKYMSTPCDRDERDELANLFKDLCPSLHKTIINWGERPPEETLEETPITKKLPRHGG